MTASIMVDTNVLVYAYDRTAGEKQQRALAVLDQLAISGAGAISTQVLSEFFVTVTRKLPHPLSPADARARIENYVLAWTIIDVTGLIVLEAVRGVETYSLSFWDAQIWAAARLNQLPVVLSEDFNTGAAIEGVRFVNPFVPDFAIADWID
jgi:predicted nucleic acid-binding protein